MTNQNKSLELFGSKSEINEMTTRLTSAMQGTRALDPKAAATLAQICVAHGLDPFNGEAWFIPGSGVMVGIKGLRKMARNQILREGGEGASYWVEFERIAKPEDYAAEPDDIVILCHLKDSQTIGEWTKIVQKFVDLGFDLAKAEGLAGKTPETEGIGIVEKNDPSKMKRIELGRKRAEASALKQRFDVDFLVDLEEEMPDIEIIDAEIEQRSAAQASYEMGYGFTPTQVEIVLAATCLTEEDEAQRFLIGSGLGLNAKDADIKKFSKYYQGEIDQDVRPKEAFENTKQNWNK